MIKKLLLTAVTITMMAHYASAQSYGPIEWDIIGVGVAFPSSESLSGGITFYSEPRYNINDNFSVGLRWEGAILAGVEDDDNIDIGLSSAWSLTPDYYFYNNKNQRAFAGLGIGLSTGGATTLTQDDGTIEEVDAARTFGLTPRVGYELGLLRFQVYYSIATDEAVTNYLGVGLAFNAGGRYRK